MSRLQKKCLIATAGGHLLLILVLVFGSAFFVSRSKPDESQILTVIPANLIDAAFSSGVAGAQPPPPQPIQPPQPPTPVQPRPEPPQPRPEPEPPQPKPTLVERVQEFFKPEPVKPQPDDLKNDEPEPKPTKPTTKKIQVNLTKVTRTTTAKTSETSEADERREAQRAAEARARAFKSAASSISDKTSDATTVDMPGIGSAAYANYDQAILSIYNQAWTSPQGLASGEAAVKVKVVISRDGKVISARITEASGNSKMDDSVRQALDRVTYTRPFPDGAKEQQRTIEFTFRARAKPLLG